MTTIDARPSTTSPDELIHRTNKPTSKDGICNRAGSRMHDTAPSTAARPIRADF